MAKLPPISRFLREDFQEVSWIEKLLQPLNQFMTLVYSALNANLTLGENMRAQIKELSITTDGSGDATASFAWGLTSIPTDLWVSRVVSVGTAPTAAVSVDWSYDGQAINITQFHGLASSSTYRIRMIAMANG